MDGWLILFQFVVLRLMYFVCLPMDVSSVPVVGPLGDLFSRTSAPLLFVRSSSRSAPGVGAARIISATTIVSQNVVDSHQY